MLNLMRSYKAFLLRIWQDKPEGRWMFTIEDPHMSERLSFNTVEALFDYILAFTDPGMSVRVSSSEDLKGAIE